MQPYNPNPPAAPYAQGAPGVPLAAVPPTAQDAPTLPGRQGRVRTWPALLVLFFLAPIMGEVLSGSTPPLSFFLNPFNALYQAALYGSGAILVRELVRRRGLGWSRILLLGAAYGILEEGLLVTSWFNPYWPDVIPLGNYGRLFQTNWVWAEGLTLYHMIYSITIPIVLVEAIFPRVASRPWLGRGGFRGFVALLAVISVLSVIGFGFVAFRDQGYRHPPIEYLVALALASGLVVLALRLPRPQPAPPTPPAPRRVPGVWALRFAGFFGTILFFFCLWGLPNIFPAAAIITMALFAGYAALAILLGRRWARRAGWGARQRLALASGATGFYIFLFDPLIEFTPSSGKVETGAAIVGLAFLVLLIVLAWRARRAERRAQAVPAYPSYPPYPSSYPSAPQQ